MTDCNSGFLIFFAAVRTDGHQCSSSFGSMEEALDSIKKLVPNVVVVDIGIPRIAEPQSVRLTNERYPKPPMLVLADYEGGKRIFDGICAAAGGYLLRRTAPTRLLEPFKEVAGGGVPISPRPVAESQSHLTPHELRLLKLLVNGHNYKSAAAELRVSINTIRFHMRRVYEKLQVHSKSEAVAKAFRESIVR